MLFVADIEGCVMPADRRPVDVAALGRLRATLDELRAAGAPWAFTFGTGRPAPYVEAIFQLIGGPWPGVPAIIENGAFLYDVAGNDLAPHPLLRAPRRASGRPHGQPSGETPGRARERALDRGSALYRAAEMVTGLLASSRWRGARREPGKAACISINPPHGVAAAAFRDEVARALDDLAGDLTITCSASSVDITPRGVDKGAGLAFLCAGLGIDPSSCIAVGDAPNDLSMLRLAGHAAAPANCHAEVRRVAEYVSPLPETLGVADIVGHYLGRRAD